MMIRMFRRPLLSFAVLASACSTVAPPPARSLTVDALHALPSQRYAISPEDAALDFSVKPFGFPAVRGSFEGFDGAVEIESARDEIIKVRATVDLDSVRFGSAWYENVVKSPAWFDVEHHPQAVFTGELAGWSGEGTGSVQGEITIKGITRPAEFAIQLDCDVADPCPQGSVGFSGEIVINRSDFEMNEFRGLVGDTVRLHFSGALVADGARLAGRSVR